MQVILAHVNVVCRFFLTARHDALFVVGPLDETMILRGMRYHPVDIENTVTRCHRAICERLVGVLSPPTPPHLFPDWEGYTVNSFQKRHSRNLYKLSVLESCTA